MLEKIFSAKLFFWRVMKDFVRENVSKQLTWYLCRYLSVIPITSRLPYKDIKPRGVLATLRYGSRREIVRIHRLDLDLTIAANKPPALTMRERKYARKRPHLLCGCGLRMVDWPASSNVKDRTCFYLTRGKSRCHKTSSLAHSWQLSLATTCCRSSVTGTSYRRCYVKSNTPAAVNQVAHTYVLRRNGD